MRTVVTAKWRESTVEHNKQFVNAHTLNRLYDSISFVVLQMPITVATNERHDRGLGMFMSLHHRAQVQHHYGRRSAGSRQYMLECPLKIGRLLGTADMHLLVALAFVEDEVWHASH